MPLGHNIKIDGLGVFSLSLGFDESSPSEKAEMKNSADAPKTKYRHVCIKDINFKPVCHQFIVVLVHPLE